MELAVTSTQILTEWISTCRGTQRKIPNNGFMPLCRSKMGPHWTGKLAYSFCWPWSLFYCTQTRKLISCTVYCCVPPEPHMTRKPVARAPGKLYSPELELKAGQQHCPFAEQSQKSSLTRELNAQFCLTWDPKEWALPDLGKIICSATKSWEQLSRAPPDQET